jgi:UDP-glucose 4-epimerase
VAIFVQALESGSPVTIHGSGAQRRDFVHVADVVDVIVLMSTMDLKGTWNVATGTAVSIWELLAQLQDVYGPVSAIRHAPRRAGDVSHSRLIVQRSREDLAWSPTVDLQEGLRSA